MPALEWLILWTPICWDLQHPVECFSEMEVGECAVFFRELSCCSIMFRTISNF